MTSSHLTFLLALLLVFHHGVAELPSSRFQLPEPAPSTNGILGLEPETGRPQGFRASAFGAPRQDSLRAVRDGEKRVTPGILATLSETGLAYAEEVLVTEVLKELLPMRVPDVTVKESFYIGSATVTLTEIVVTSAVVPEAAITPGQNQSITLFAEGTRAAVTLKWAYSVGSILGDKGRADVQVQGMNIGVMGNLTERNGTLALGIIQSGAVIEKLNVTLSGGLSWAYNWLIYSFTNHLRAAVESAVNTGVLAATRKLDNYLQNLPRLVPVDSVAAIDIRIVEDPVIKTESVSFAPHGQFVSTHGSLAYPRPPAALPQDAACGGRQKMVTLALSDFVINSAALVYYEAGKLTYLVDELPEPSPVRLNTASWRFVIPKLYHQYPNQPMMLNFSVAGAPLVTFGPAGVGAAMRGNMVILVAPEGQPAVPVASLIGEVSVEGSAAIEGSNMTGVASLDDLSLEMEWSTIGSFPTRSLLVVVRALVKGILLPILNRSLKTGFPLPDVPGVAFRDAAVVYGKDFLLVCTDVLYTGGIFNRSAAEGNGGAASGRAAGKGWPRSRRSWLPPLLQLPREGTEGGRGLGRGVGSSPAGGRGRRVQVGRW